MLTTRSSACQPTAKHCNWPYIEAAEGAYSDLDDNIVIP